MKGYISTVSVDLNENIAESVVKLEQDLNTGRQILDTKFMYIGHNKCVLFCRGQLGLNIQCLGDTTDGLKLDYNQDIAVDFCAGLSVTPGINHHHRDFTSYISVLHGTDQDQLRILKLQADMSFAEIENISVSPNSHSSIFSFTEPGGTETCYLIILPPQPEPDLNIYKLDLETNTFKLDDTLEGVRATDAEFLLPTDELTSLVLQVARLCNSDEDCSSIIETYSYRFYSGFSGKRPTEYIKYMEPVSDMQLVLNSNNQKFVLTHASADQSDLPIQTYIYKEHNVAQYREEFQNSVNLAPEFVSLDCHTLVGKYLKRLYSDENYDIPTIARIYMALMTRAHITIRPQDFPQQISQILTDPRFQEDLDPEPPVAVANIYMYVNTSTFERSYDDSAYLGSCLVYKGTDEVLYLYCRLLLDDLTGSYYAVSFAEDCDGGPQIPFSAYNGSDYNPHMRNDTDEISGHQCSLVHDVDQTFCQKLDNLDNKADAGAIIIHKGESTSDQRLGCGYLKKPVTSKIQFYRDHNEQDIKFDPYIRISV
eukprot:TRINITY_DN10678_c0_g1_i2.p1 TRINITY_DN10678_c0_g1~~TRINITY_DN10678_c0_g1_i2.p1  ORF type:complete len:538 (-),score=82.61 TRINITY_DN10678_c0_g1_i2:63-1676(-)